MIDTKGVRDAAFMLNDEGGRRLANALCDEIDRLREENERLKAPRVGFVRSEPGSIVVKSVIELPAPATQTDFEKALEEVKQKFYAAQRERWERDDCECQHCRARRESAHREREEAGHDDPA